VPFVIPYWLPLSCEKIFPCALMLNPIYFFLQPEICIFWFYNLLFYIFVWVLYGKRRFQYISISLELKVFITCLGDFDNNLLTHLSSPAFQVTWQPLPSLTALLRTQSLCSVLFFYLKSTSIKKKKSVVKCASRSFTLKRKKVL